MMNRLSRRFIDFRQQPVRSFIALLLDSLGFCIILLYFHSSVHVR